MPTYSGTPITPSTSYCTLAQLKASDHLNITDSVSDTILNSIIEAVSRWIDEQTGRVFYSVSAVARYYSSDDSTKIFIDDFYTTAGLVIETDENADGVFEKTWQTTDYTVCPYNPHLGWPYESIETSPTTSLWFPTGKRGVKITAAWGWSSVPKQIEDACLLQCERLFKRYSTPLGSAGMTALGEMKLSIPAADQDVHTLLEPFKRWLI